MLNKVLYCVVIKMSVLFFLFFPLKEAARLANLASSALERGTAGGTIMGKVRKYTDK